MCGILGYASLQRPARSPAWRAALETMAYRGPDARGLYLAPASGPGHLLDPTISEADALALWPEGPAVFFGHLRLAIIDLAHASDQPLQRGPLTLVFNGEIYNYLELRAELRTLGHAFVTDGDSEVILAAYAQWGRDCASRLRGMFALAIQDSDAGTMWLARDRFAIKPLHIALRRGIVAFASEARVLPVLLGEAPEMNDRALYHLLAHWASDFDAECFYSGVEALLPGEDVLIDLRTHQLSRRRWYDLRATAPQLAPLPESDDSVAQFRNAFDESIALHLRADVPIGIGLSGGLDSSSILGTVAYPLGAPAASRQGAAKNAAKLAALPGIQTFSSVFDAPEASEGRYIHAVLDYTGADGSFVTPQRDALLARLPELTALHDGPLAGPSQLVQHSVMELAKAHGVKVVLNGQGGDELLCGYLRFAVLNVLGELRRNPMRGLGSAAQLLAHGDPRIPRLIYSSLVQRRGAQPIGQRMRRLGALLRPERFARYAGEGHPAPYSTDMQALRLQDLQTWPIPALCASEDRSSMSVSLESRVPLLDHVLVECALRLPASLLFHRGLSKYVLRAAMAGRIPELVRWRRDKLGFPAPERTWLGAMSFGEFRGRLTAEGRLAELFSPDALSEREWAGLDPRQRFMLLAVDAWVGRL